MSLESLMNATVDVQRKISVTSGLSMTQVATYSTVFANARCRIQPHTSRRRDEFVAPGMRTESRVHFYPAIQVQIGDVLIVTSGISRVGEQYEVKGAFEPDHAGLFSAAFVDRYGPGLDEVS